MHLLFPREAFRNDIIFTDHSVHGAALSTAFDLSIHRLPCPVLLNMDQIGRHLLGVHPRSYPLIRLHAVSRPIIPYSTNSSVHFIRDLCYWRVMSNDHPMMYRCRQGNIDSVICLLTASSRLELLGHGHSFIRIRTSPVLGIPLQHSLLSRA